MDTRNKSGYDERGTFGYDGQETPRAPETPGGLPFSLAQRLNGKAVEQGRA